MFEIEIYLTGESKERAHRKETQNLTQCPINGLQWLLGRTEERLMWIKLSFLPNIVTEIRKNDCELSEPNIYCCMPMLQKDCQGHLFSCYCQLSQQFEVNYETKANSVPVWVQILPRPQRAQARVVNKTSRGNNQFKLKIYKSRVILKTEKRPRQDEHKLFRHYDKYKLSTGPKIRKISRYNMS